MKSFLLSVLVILEVHEKWKIQDNLKHNLQRTEKRTISEVEKHWLSRAHIYTLKFWGKRKCWKCFGSAEIAPVSHIKTIKFSWKYLHWWKAFCKCNLSFWIVSVGTFWVNECFIWHKMFGQMVIYATRKLAQQFHSLKHE